MTGHKIWDIENIKNEEVIWVINYSDDPTFTNAQLTDTNGDLFDTAGLIQREGGNTGHLMWEVRYENLSWGMIRDLENGRGFQRWGPTKFFIDLYDESIDERFYGSFKNVWICNRETSLPTWPETILIDGTEVAVPTEDIGEAMFGLGDTAIVFIKQHYLLAQELRKMRTIFLDSILRKGT